AGGHLTAFRRMDGAFLGSIDVAIKKANSSILFQMNSEAIFDFCKPGAQAPGLERSNGGLMPFGGGIPLFDDGGTMIGAIGVSGGAVVQDVEVAEAGRDALDAVLRAA
ncbi:MAG: heme-binding protein, partial [Acidobacteriota bacterium]